MGQLVVVPLKRFHPKRYHPGKVSTWSGHLPFAHDIVAALRPEILVELGTHFGESYFGFCQAVEENAVGCKCYAVDTWRGDDHAGLYGEEVFEEVNAYNKLHYPAFSTLLRETFDDANRQFRLESVDLLHIDGLHTYEAVKHDFDIWLPKMRPGGIVLLHDINARFGSFRVWQFWEELQTLYPQFEFTHSWGLGVVQVGHPPSQEADYLRLLLHSPERDKVAIREQYVLAADNLELSHRLLGSAWAEEPRATAQVFAGMPFGFSESNSTSASIQVREWRRYRFPLEQGCAVGEVRIDFANCPCVIELAAISIRRAADESEILYDLTRPADLMALTCRGDLLPIGDGREAKFLSYGHDPQVYLSLGDTPGLMQPIIVELWMRVDLEFGAIAALLREGTPAGSWNREAAVHESELAKLRAERERLEMERTLALRSMESLSGEVRLHQNERLVLSAEFRRLSGLRRYLEAENEEVRERLRREQNVRIAIEQEAAESRTLLEQLRWTVANQESELNELRPDSASSTRLADFQHQLYSLQEQLSHERARREDLEGSYSWRVTGPVRGALKLLGRSR